MPGPLEYVREKPSKIRARDWEGSGHYYNRGKGEYQKYHPPSAAAKANIKVDEYTHTHTVPPTKYNKAPWYPTMTKQYQKEHTLTPRIRKRNALARKIHVHQHLRNGVVVSEHMRSANESACDRCLGSGVISCPECGGGRRMEECLVCNGRGRLECPNCQGKGKVYYSDGGLDAREKQYFDGLDDEESLYYNGGRD